MKDLVNMFLKKIFDQKETLSINFTNLRNTKLGKSIDLSILNDLDLEILNDPHFVSLFVELVLDNTDTEKSLVEQYISLKPEVKANINLATCLISFNGGERYSLNNEPYYHCETYKHLPKSLLKNKEFIINVWKYDPKALLLAYPRSLFDEKALITVENERKYLDEVLASPKKEMYAEGATLILFKTKIEEITESDMLCALEESNFGVFKRPEILSKFKGKLTSKAIEEFKKVLEERNIQPALFNNSLDEEYTYKSTDEVKDILKNYLI